MAKFADFEIDASRAAAKSLDATDPLSSFRRLFHFPLDAEGGEIRYFTGNSLGLQPISAKTYIQQELEDWARFGVEGHIHARNPWLPYHELVTEPVARVVGALPGEVVVMNALTVNLHLMMVSFYRPTPERSKIIIEKGAFPSDQYAVTSQIDFHSRHLKVQNGVPDDQRIHDRLIELAPREGEDTLRTEDILETIEREGDQVALILLGGVNYYTGQAFDMQAITAAGHRKGCLVGFDCAHAAGNLELKLHEWDVDFACWCSYKYLNAGPGAIAGVFVHERHATSFDLPRFAGWWGHDKKSRFLMGPEFQSLPGAEGWQLSNPPIFQLAALRAAIEIFDEAGMANLRKKSEHLTGYLEFLLDQIDDPRIKVITPRDPEQRGCQLSIRIRNADKRLFDRVTAAGISVDWREPDVMRAAPVPLYNSYEDVWYFANVLRESLAGEG